MERRGTGIKGLDERLEGGFPFPSSIIIAGEPGAGKTTLALQSLFHGARNNERGLYVTGVSEPVDQLNRFTEHYSFYDKKILEEKRIEFLDVGAILIGRNEKKEHPAEKALSTITKLVLKQDIGRVVIDPITPFADTFQDSLEYRRFLHEAFITLKALNTLTIVCSEASPGDLTDVANYIADGILLLHLQPTANPSVFKPGLQVRKMRGTEHTKDILTMGFTKDGMRILAGGAG